MANKSKYNEQYHVPWIKGLARRGYTVEEIARDMEVAPSTVHKWISENEELSEAIKKGRLFADTQVEESLYKRAVGYTYTERKTILQTGKDGGSLPARVEVVEKEIAPDVTACIFWLKNRCPDLWRDRVENVVQGKLDVNEKDGAVSLKDVPDELMAAVVESIRKGQKPGA